MQETEIKVRNSSQSQCMTAEKRSQRELCSSIGTWHELWSPTNQHRLPAARGLVPPTPRQNAATPSSHEEESICILGEQAGERERETGVITRRGAPAPYEHDICTMSSTCGCRQGRDIYSLGSPRDSF
jgi:hypothetical protein